MEKYLILPKFVEGAISEMLICMIISVVVMFVFCLVIDIIVRYTINLIKDKLLTKMPVLFSLKEQNK